MSVTYHDSMVFVNRESELGQLAEWWASPQARPGLVWGRRRVGKTALLVEFANRIGTRTIFHIGGTRTPQAELSLLADRAAMVTGLERRFRDWDDALDRLAAQAAQTPILLVLDEFPELMRSSPELPGVIRAFLDRPEGTGSLRLLICGSAVRTMQSIQEYRAPLYGRFDLVLQVHPFRPHEAVLMLQDLSPADRALVYGIVGGTPLYLSWWQQHQSAIHNVSRLACQPGARLLSEGELVLATEAAEGEYPAAVLEAIAAGKTRHHEIADVLGADPSRTLRQLQQLRLVEQLVPVTDQERRTRRKIYRIKDPFLAFYLGPLTRYRAEIEQGIGAGIATALLDAAAEHFGSVYEEAFRDHLRRRAATGEFGHRVVGVGPWWREDGRDEIDAVVLAEPERTRIPVLAGEAKWAKSVSAGRVVETLRRKAGRLTPDLGQLAYAVCAREKVTDTDRVNCIPITAADVFG